MKPRPVLQGDEIVMPVQGGVKRRPAERDGYYLDEDPPRFIAAEDFESARVELREQQLHRRGKRRGR